MARNTGMCLSFEGKGTCQLFQFVLITSDVKSIIAFSTVSQLSYMFMGLLISPTIVVYHIIIHAFFKSALFIIAGSCI